MTERAIFNLVDINQAHKLLVSNIWPGIKTMLEHEQRVIIEVRPETRTLAQNAKMWAMLTDISDQVIWHGQKLSPDDWKNVFTAALVQQNLVPGIDGGVVVLGQSTSKMTKAEINDLMELIYSFGANNGAKFSQF